MQANGCGPSRALGDAAGSEVLPRSLILLVHCVAGTCPILHLIDSGIRFSPGDANCINVFILLKIYYYPLRMEGVVLASEALGQIRIAFPIGLGIAVVETRESVELRPIVSRESAVGK